MPTLKTSSGSHRLYSLDSIRGLACLAVVFGHSLSVFSWDISYINYPIINNIFDGLSAVAFFFVLSGFVLTLGYVNPSPDEIAPEESQVRKLDIIPFYVRRISRIWLPWFSFFILSLIFKSYFPRNNLDLSYQVSAHHANFWSENATISEFFKQMAFMLHNYSKILIPQDWSLGVELKASLLIPFLIIVLRKSYLAMLCLGFLLYFASPGTGFYYSSFVLGMLAAYIYRKFEHRRNQESYWAMWCLIIGFSLYQFRWISENYTNLDRGPVWIVSAFACFLLLLGILFSPNARGILSCAPLVFLGRISFSLYLGHVLILICFSQWFLFFLESVGVENLYFLQVCFISLVLTSSLLLAWAGERWIEVPSVLLGRKLCKMLPTKMIAQKPPIS